MTAILLIEHLYIVVLAVLLSLLIGLPLGLISYLNPILRKLILWVSDFFQTIPSLALLGILMVFFGAGKLVVIVGITLYSLLPIVRNTYLGFQQVPEGLKEAAKGCGMSHLQRLFKVELPQALPMIFTGIRIAAVGSIGTAVFAAFVGGGGLGTAIYQGIRVRNMSLILLPTIALMVIAFAFDLIMGLIERTLAEHRSGKIRNKLFLCMIAAAVTGFSLWGSIIFTDTESDDTLVMYDGNYSETKLITRIIKGVVEEYTDLTVEIKGEMTLINNFRALTDEEHSCDLMPNYDGTLLVTHLHQDVTDIPEGMTLYEYVNQEAMKRWNVRLLDKLGINNTYVIAVKEDLAAEFGLKTVSDLIPVAGQLVFGAEHEFFTQEGKAKFIPFTAAYGLHFKDSVSVDLGLKYNAIENNSFEVTEVYSTDGLNRKVKLHMLEDDLHFFPEYNGAVLVRNDIFERFADEAPNLEAVLNKLSGVFSNESMTDLTYQVDVLGYDVDRVAYQFMVQNKLIDR